MLGQASNDWALNVRTQWLYQFLMLGVLNLSTLAVHAADFPVRLSGLPEEPVYVGQQVRFSVTLFFTERPTGTPQFRVPEATGGILLKLPDSPIFGTDKIDENSYTTWNYDFVFYPHRSGSGQIPSITVRADIGSESVSGVTEIGTISTVMPPGAEGLSTLVSTTDFVVTESWQPKPDAEAKVGDAFTRTITLKAPNILGMGFPPLPQAKPENVGVYPRSPTVNDTSTRGQITGARSETIVYVCENEGIVTLPGMVIPWFDLDSRKLNRIELASHSIAVAPNPALLPPQDQGASTKTESKPFELLLFTMGAFLILLVWVWLGTRATPPLKRWIAHCKHRRDSSEKFAFEQLTRVVSARDALGIINRAHIWLRRLPGNESCPTLTAFAARFGSDDFCSAVEILMHQNFGTPALPDLHQNVYEEIASGLIAARRRYFRQKRASGPQPLPPLNPPASHLSA